MKTIILVFLLSVMAFGQSGKSVLTQAQKDSIQAMIDIRAGNYFNVASANVNGDNATSDADAFESAVSDNGDKVYFFPKGVYNFSTLDLTSTEPLKIIGEDKDSTIIVFDKDDRNIGITLGNSLYLENITIKTAAKPIKIPADLSKTIDYFIIRNVIFDDIREKCAFGNSNGTIGTNTRFNYGEISNCEIKNSDGGFNIQMMFNNFKAYNNYFHDITDTISEPKSVPRNNGTAAFYIGNESLTESYDTGVYDFYDNTFQNFLSDLRQPITGVNTTLNTFYVPDNTIDSNEVVYIRIESFNDTVPSPLTNGASYRVVYSQNDTIKISTTAGGSPIDITSEGVGNFNFFATEQSKAILCYGKHVSVHNNFIDNMISYYKPTAAAIYVRAVGSGQIDNNVIYNAGTGDGIIALKTGQHPEQSSISGNYIYKDNQDLYGDAIYTTTYSKVNNNTIIFRNESTVGGTGGGISFSTIYTYDTYPLIASGNTIILENPDEAITLSGNYKGDVLVFNNHIEVSNEAQVLGVGTSNDWGTDPDSLFLTNIKFNNNYIRAKGDSRITVGYFTKSFEYKNNVVIIDSMSEQHILTENEPKGIINISNNTFIVNSVIPSPTALIQNSSSADADMLVNDNIFYIGDNFYAATLLALNGTFKSMQFNRNSFYRDGDSTGTISGMLYIQGDVTNDVIVNGNIVDTSSTTDLSALVYLRNSIIGGDLIMENNKLEPNAVSFIQYQGDNVIGWLLDIKNNISRATNFFYNNAGTSTLSPNDTKYLDNDGYFTSNSGIATVNASSDSVIIGHGLSLTPDINNISVTPQGSVKGNWWISDVSSTDFTINTDSTQASNVDFSWQIKESNGVVYGDIPNFESIGALAYGTTSVSVPYPSTVDSNDILIMQVSAYEDGTNQSINTPSGWSVGDSSKYGAYIVYWFWKRADGTEAGNVNVTGTNDDMKGLISRWSGCITTGLPFELLTNNSFTTSETLSTKQLSIKKRNRLAVCLVNVLDAVTAGAMSNYTEVFDSSTTEGTLNVSFIGEILDSPNAGVVAIDSATLSASKTYTAFTFALKPTKTQTF